MKVSDVMTRTPIAVRADATLLEAAKIMVEARVSGLPVIDDEGSLVGMPSPDTSLGEREVPAI